MSLVPQLLLCDHTKGHLELFACQKDWVCFDMLFVVGLSIPWWLIKLQEIPFFPEGHLSRLLFPFLWSLCYPQVFFRHEGLLENA